jgi:hypothetical protein
MNDFHTPLAFREALVMVQYPKREQSDDMLEELLEHHIEEEENGMRPEAEEGLELEDLGRQVMQMKTRLSSGRKRSSSGWRKAA